MAPALVFTVRRQAPVLVPPSEPTPRELKALSDVDNQSEVQFHMQGLVFYRCNPSSLHAGRDPAGIIRDAVAKALVHYYPLAGRLRQASDGRTLDVDCTGEGILFVEADADIRLEQLGDRLLPPIAGWEEFLHDVEGSFSILHTPLLLVQVTRLACGGFVLGLRFNHAFCDAIGFAQFMNAVCEIARGASDCPSIKPVWRRELLKARNPPWVTCVHPEFGGVVEPDAAAADSDVHDNNGSNKDDEPVQRSFFFGRREVVALRHQLPPHLQLRSTHEIIAACSWRCRTIAIRCNPHERVRMISVVNMRERLNPPLPVGYYGCALADIAAVTTASELCSNPLGYAVELIAMSLSRATDEFLRSQIDYLANYEPDGRGLRYYMVSNTRHIGLDRFDFGWGLPVYGGVAEASALCSYLQPIRNREGKFEGLALLITLPSSAMDRFAAEVDKMVTATTASWSRI